jgi:DNA-binding GntR family transcriptional regulator
MRAAILRGDYADGQHVNQADLATKYSVDRSVIWRVLVGLENEGYVSRDTERRFHVNAGYLSRQLQLQRNRLTALNGTRHECS